MMKARMTFRALAVAAVGVTAFQLCAALPPAERAVVLSESLSRLSPDAVQQDPKLRAALDQALQSMRGTPQFVTLVQKFGLKGHEAALLEFAQSKPSDDIAVSAMRIVVANAATDLLKAALKGPKAVVTADALGNVTHKRAVALLASVLDDAATTGDLRKQAVRSLARTQNGANDLFARTRAGTLPGDLYQTAGEALRGAQFAAVREEAGKVFASSAATPSSGELPPVAELLKRHGDAANGAKVFRRETINCIGCHQINGEGKDFGPALSEIGTKLGKDVLYQSIIEPSAGISFGFESWSVELKNGDEFYGLVVNETENELTIQDARAIPTTVKKSDIARRAQSKLSIMPTGLPQLMTQQELVDLVEYLATLKKK
jgi:putative heme-binding domain-containing protein